MEENKAKALAAALSQIEKQFGKGSIMRLGESEVSKDVMVPRAHSASTLRSASGAFRGAAWSRSTARNHRARPR